MLSMTASAQESAFMQSVDPTIGGVGILLEPTRPTVHLPNQMIRWTPTRADMLDDRISEYPLTITSHRRDGVFAFLPMTGDDESGLFHLRQIYDTEVTRPYYYSANLEGCDIAFAPSKKSGIISVSFEGNAKQWFRFRTISKDGDYVLLDKRTIAGQTKFQGMTAYMYAVLDHDILNTVYETGKHMHLLAFLGKEQKTVMMRYGISYISVDQAKKNLEKEIPGFSFQKVKDAALKIWEPVIGQIEVRGGSESQKRVFYTALYRCSERMVDINEYGNYFSSFDHQVHHTSQPFYVDNWIWDQHVALEPLQTILHPKMETEKINSYIDMYRQGGTMPSFAVTSGDWPAMIGNFAAAWMADGWFKGLRFDLKTAYEGLKKNSLDATLIPWRNGEKTVLDDFYNEHGYFPALQKNEKEYVDKVDTNWERRQSVSITTGNSYSDWCIAQLARELGKKEDTELFLKRSAFYRNLWNPANNFLWPKDSAGRWIKDVDPRYADRAYYTENNAYTFQWDVKHDMKGLISLMGGPAKAEKLLDESFRIPLGMAKYRFWCLLPDETGMVGQFSMGNEPSFHIPYLYDYMGCPWKTQKRIRMLLHSFFTDEYSGIPGDEDGGGMSAFVVFSMMGFFPVTPGIPVYSIGSPIFEDVTVHLSDGKSFRVLAHDNSDQNKYIQSASLNGHPLQHPWITHEDIMKGGVLEFQMGPRPNKQWGSAPEDAPPSELSFINKRQ